MKRVALGLIALATAVFGQSAKKGEEAGMEQIRVLPVARTPESATVSVVIPIPAGNSVVKGNPVWMQLRVDGYPLATDSQFDRASELVDNNMGQTIHIVVDNMPYFAINGPAIDPFNEEGYFYDTSYKFEIPTRLPKGMHTLRVFPARSFGESLKGEQTFFVTTFYLGSADDSTHYDFSKPFLTYNEPSDYYRHVESKPVLLDFYISNCELTPDGYKVRLTVDGKMHRTLTSWQPYYIYGLKRGKHTIRLELIDRSNKVVPGSFNTIEQSITIS
jgi:hypothetical protein